MNKKKTILFIIVFLIIILIAIVAMIKYLRNKVNNTEQLEIGSSIISEYAKNENNSISRDSYFDINTCMLQYLQMLNTQKSNYYGRGEDGKFTLIVEEKQIKKNIYDLLSENYINKNNITLENLYDHVDVLEKQVLFVPLEASVIQDSEIARFLVHGLVETLDLNVIDEIFVIVNIDVANALFSIEPIKGEYSSISEIDIEQTNEKIEANENNKFNRYSINFETISKDYINLYKRLALGKPEVMYNFLDKDYRDARFGSVEEFKRYINTNKKKINGIRVEKYQAIEEDGYTRHICVDQNDNYYIFKENGVLNYSVMLDTYTIDLPEFIKKYESSADNLKVALNIEKLIEATKMGDYRYVYNKLNQSFKTSNFPTLESFEKFIKERFNPEEDTVQYDRYEKVTGVHVYDIVVTDKSENKTINAKVVMNLKEERDFELSFSAE